MSTRPTHKELTHKIQQAIRALSQGRIRILEPEVIASDALQLGYQISEVSDLLVDALSRLSAKDYIGYRPPEKSYEEKIKSAELFAFKAWSQILGCNIYLKFVLKGELVWIVSLHEFEEKGENP